MFSKEEKKRVKRVEAEIENLKLTIQSKVSMEQVKDELAKEAYKAITEKPAKLDLNMLPEKIQEAKAFKDLVTKMGCPACGHEKLLLDLLTQTPDGWQGTLHCENCIFKGTINSDGFHFEDMHGRGRTKSE